MTSKFFAFQLFSESLHLNVVSQASELCSVFFFLPFCFSSMVVSLPLFTCLFTLPTEISLWILVVYFSFQSLWCFASEFLCFLFLCVCVKISILLMQHSWLSSYFLLTPWISFRQLLKSLSSKSIVKVDKVVLLIFVSFWMGYTFCSLSYLVFL